MSSDRTPWLDSPERLAQWQQGQGALVLPLCRQFVALFGVGLRVSDANGAVLLFSDPLPPREARGGGLGWGEKEGTTTLNHVLHAGGEPCLTLVLGPFQTSEESVAPGVPTLSPQTAQRILGFLVTALEEISEADLRAFFASQMHVQGLSATHAELAQAQEALARARQELDSLEQSRNSFMAAVSHELRTPLTSIIGFAELLQQESGLQGAHARAIVDQAARLERMIEDVLELSRLREGQTSLTRIAVSPRALVEQVCEKVRSKAKKRRVELELSAQGVPDWPLDHDRIARALENILDNAIRFSPDDATIQLTLDVVEETDRGAFNIFDPVQNERICITVRDAGPGIDEADHARIFDAFVQLGQLDAADSPVRGSGLGLTLARHYVALHHGRIEVESSPGAGARFRMLLPRA